jgi:hypothetical protein
LKRDVQILNVSIRRAWYKDSLVADVVLAAADYAKALGMNGTLLHERRITVNPFMSGKSPHHLPHQAEMVFSVRVNAIEWSVLQLFRAFLGQGARIQAVY